MMVGGRRRTLQPSHCVVGYRHQVTYVGNNGLALSMKIATNLSLAVQMLAFCEGVLLAEKSGIARATAVDVLTHSAVASPMVQYRGPFVLRMPEEAWFDVNMMQKDMLLALESGPQTRCPLTDYGGGERVLDGGARYGLGEPGFCGGFRRAGTNVGSFKMTIVAGQPKTDSGLAVEQWIRMYRRMLTIRLFEEQVNDLYTRALMPGLAHLYIGEEAVAVGVCEALRTDDYITSTHRGHGHCLAKGAEPGRMFAELLGKEAGYCRGKGGSMHIADSGHGQPRGECHRGGKRRNRHRSGLLIKTSASPAAKTGTM